jgi:hypothetical protein
MTTLLGSTRRAVAAALVAALVAVAPLPLVAQQGTPPELLTVREIDDLARPIAQLSDEALDQVLRLLAERPAWAIAMGRAYRQQPGDVRAAIENQRRVAVVTVPVLSPMPAPAPAPTAPVAPAPPTVIVQPAPVVVQQPMIVVPNPVFAPPPVIVHAPPIVHGRPWTFWPWTRTIIARPIYIDRGRDRDRDRDRNRRDDDRRDRPRETRTSQRADRAERPIPTPEPPRKAKPRAVASGR